MFSHSASFRRHGRYVQRPVVYQSHGDVRNHYDVGQLSSGGRGDQGIFVLAVIEIIELYLISGESLHELLDYLLLRRQD